MNTAEGQVLRPKAPDSRWLQNYLEPNLIGSSAYEIDTPRVRIKLDQNESPWDLPRSIKEKIAQRLVEQPWNRYPTAYAENLTELVAQYTGVTPASVLLGPGSNYLVALVLSVLSKGYLKKSGTNQGKLVIARPSFALYEAHCRAEGVPYEAWPLSSELEYDPALLPYLPDGSMVVFASPNNPVGNSLPKSTLQNLLETYPKTLFVADEAYYEYSDEPYTDLLSRFANLLLIRTFSKTLGAAGVRLGYVIGAGEYIHELKKLRLPYLLNHFTLIAAHEILSDSGTKAHLANTIKTALQERQWVYEELMALGKQGRFEVKNSLANFLLVRWPSQDAAVAAYKSLIEAGILVRNVSKGPGLSGCLRITLGTTEENKAVLEAFKQRLLT